MLGYVRLGKITVDNCPEEFPKPSQHWEDAAVNPKLDYAKDNVGNFKTVADAAGTNNPVLRIVPPREEDVVRFLEDVDNSGHEKATSPLGDVPSFKLQVKKSGKKISDMDSDRIFNYIEEYLMWYGEPFTKTGCYEIELVGKGANSMGKLEINNFRKTLIGKFETKFKGTSQQYGTRVRKASSGALKAAAAYEIGTYIGYQGFIFTVDILSRMFTGQGIVDPAMYADPFNAYNGLKPIIALGEYITAKWLDSQDRRLHDMYQKFPATPVLKNLRVTKA